MWRGPQWGPQSPAVKNTGPGVVPFDISFHDSTANTVPGGGHPFSLPTTLLLLQPVVAQEFYVGVDQGGDYVYRYDAYLPQWFYQQGTTANPIEYFMDIDQPLGQNWAGMSRRPRPVSLNTSPTPAPGPAFKSTTCFRTHDRSGAKRGGTGGFGLLALLISRRRRQ